MPVPSVSRHMTRQSSGKGGNPGAGAGRPDKVQVLGVENDTTFRDWDGSFDGGNEIDVTYPLSGNAMVPSHCRDKVPDESDSRVALTVP